MEELWQELRNRLRAMRFSLATLLFAILFIASVVAVWVNRAPWEIAAKIKLPDPSFDSSSKRPRLEYIRLLPTNKKGQVLVLRNHKAHRMSVWNWQTGELTHVSFPDSEILLETSPTAGRFLTSDRSGTARVRQIGSETPLAELPHWIFPTAANPRISPDGNRIAAIGPDGTVWVYDLHTQTEKSIPARSESPEQVHLEFSADGRWVCAVELKKQRKVGWQLIDYDHGASVDVPEDVDAWANKISYHEFSFNGSAGQLFLAYKCWWTGTTKVQECPGASCYDDINKSSGKTMLFLTNRRLNDSRAHTATLEVWTMDLTKRLGTVSPDVTLSGNWIVSDNGSQIILNPVPFGTPTTTLWSTVTGQQIHTFPVPLMVRHFLDEDHLLCQMEGQPELQVWRRRRDETAWGMMGLPEVWLAVVFLVATMLSVRRDRKRLRDPAA